MPITFANNQLFLAWEGNDEHLYVASSSDGKTFSNKHLLAERALKSTRPALTEGKGLIFLAWIDHEEHINIISSPDGLYWSNKRTIEETAHKKCPPALTYFNDRLYLAWTGRDHKNHVNITSFTVADDGELAEYAKVTLDEESTDEAGPALASANGLLSLVWLGRDDHVNVVETSNGKDFQNKHTLRERSPHTATPGITFGDGHYYLSWIGHDDRLNLDSSTDGLAWSNKVTLNEKSTGTGVASVAYGNSTLFLDWSGTDHKHHVNIMRFKIESTDGAIPQGEKVVLEEEEEK